MDDRIRTTNMVGTSQNYEQLTRHLQNELMELMDKADLFRGIHGEVEKKRIFTKEYLRQVRLGLKDIKAKEQNIEKLSLLIDEYKRVLREKTKKVWSM